MRYSTFWESERPDKREQNDSFRETAAAETVTATMTEQRMAGDLQRRLRHNHDFLKKSSNGLTKYKTGSKLAADFKSNCYESLKIAVFLTSGAG